MSKSAISVSAWAEMSEAQRIERVRVGQATLKEMVEGLLDGPKNLQDTCRVFLMQSDVCLQQPNSQAREPIEQPTRISNEQAAALLEGARKRRQGLPQGYVPRPHRH